jgi:drug/metabolite transporter (DMT)-like permease
MIENNSLRNLQSFDMDPPRFTPTGEDSNPVKLSLIWAVLFISLIGGASVGPYYFYIQPDCQLLKASWRLIAFAFGLLPLLYNEYRENRDGFMYSKQNLVNRKSLEAVFWASLGYSAWTVGLVIALNHTSVAQASLFANLCPIIIILNKMCNKEYLNQLEKFGTLVALIGVLFLIFDKDFSSKEGMVNIANVGSLDRFLFGTVIAILGSIGGAFYLTKNQEVKYDYPPVFGIFVMAIMGFVQITVASMFLEGATLNFNSQTGILGLFSGEWFLIYVFMTLIVGYGGYFGYAYSVKYFDASFISLVLVFEPVVGALVVYIAGWQSVPGLLTFLGAFCIIPGIIVVIKGQKKPVFTSLSAYHTSTYNNTVPLIPLEK